MCHQQKCWCHPAPASSTDVHVCWSTGTTSRFSREQTGMSVENGHRDYMKKTGQRRQQKTLAISRAPPASPSDICWPPGSSVGYCGVGDRHCTPPTMIMLFTKKKKGNTPKQIPQTSHPHQPHASSRFCWSPERLQISNQKTRQPMSNRHGAPSFRRIED